ncbi:ABC transporter ATP-binding protein [Thalassotalea euphylliae]|uniref:ABC transporter ATP-binding protein n=1 Tax=Thalassotalea euphylliae TaxID=1655234 RepID=A0A3E0TM46_9GAMM|nr:ABC transporter ATP-binding protein [Thalassotalea euphylliae]REL25463.1 ABC transporter ATP-binding protein [Thalassotalea euphylliae]
MQRVPQDSTYQAANNQAASSQVACAQLHVTELGWQSGGKAILRRINFALQSGEFVGLLGPNGSGKSSLLRCLYRYHSPTAGQVHYQGRALESYSQQAYAQQVAVVLQESPSFFNLSVSDVVELGLLPRTSVWHRTSKAEKQHVENALAQVAMLDKATQGFDSLSGGEKQRVLIARAIVQQPSLLIMDEPTSHLDVKYQIQIINLAKSLGITVLASFHDLNLASAMCDRLLVLSNGELVADGKPSDILSQTLLAQVFGVTAQLQTHPEHGKPLITYQYFPEQELPEKSAPKTDVPEQAPTQSTRPQGNDQGEQR